MVSKISVYGSQMLVLHHSGGKHISTTLRLQIGNVKENYEFCVSIDTDPIQLKFALPPPLRIGSKNESKK